MTTHSQNANGIGISVCDTPIDYPLRASDASYMIETEAHPMSGEGDLHYNGYR